MTAQAMVSTTAGKSRAWIVLFALGALLVLNMLFLLIIGGGEEQFESDTGVTFAEVSDSYPTVAQLVGVQEQLVAVGFMGFSLFITVLAYIPYRAGERWSWYAMWILPGTLGLTTAIMFINGSEGIGAFYAAIFIAAVLPLLVSRRVFFPK